jgi:hypothetical protein
MNDQRRGSDRQDSIERLPWFTNVQSIDIFRPMSKVTRRVASGLGVFAGFGGPEHGYFEIDLASLGDQPSARVVSIEPGVVPRGPRLQAEVEVVIEDTLGTPVAEAQVVLRVFGDITQVAVGVTGADGQVAVRTRRAAPAPVSYSVCVLTVIADIPYQAADNLETCDTL